MKNGDALNERAIVISIGLAVVLAPLNSTMIMLALPTFQSIFDLQIETIGWLVTLYLIVMASLQIVTGKLGDRLGRRLPILGGLLLFAIASLIAASAPNFILLLAGRFFQAVSAALIVPNGFALIREIVPKERRATQFGFLGAIASSSAALGPPLGGFLLEYFSWSAMFYLSTFIALLSFGLGWIVIPHIHKETKDLKFDRMGSILFTCLLAAMTFVLVNLKTHVDSRLIGGSVFVIGGLILFIFHELKVEDPVFNLNFFRSYNFSAGCICIALSNLSMYSAMMAIPLILAKQSEWSYLNTGMILMAMSITSAAIAPIGGKISDHFGRKLPIVTGLLLLSLGTIFLWVTLGTISLYSLVLGLGVTGIGIGLTFAALQTIALESIAKKDSGSGAGIILSSRYLGSIIGSIAVSHLLVLQTSRFMGYYVFLMIAFSAVVCFLLSLLISRTGTYA